MILRDLIDIYRPASPRFDAAYWSACNLWSVTFRDGGDTLLDESGPDLEAVLERMLDRARAHKARKRSSADLLA